MAPKRVKKHPKRSLKMTGRRGLSLFLSLVMMISLVQIGAFAAGRSDGLDAQQRQNKAEQVVNPGGTETVVEDRVIMTKEAEITDTEGKFLVTLQVKTKDKIKQVTEISEPTIDVVLVIDNSSSMNKGGRLDSAKEAATQFVNSFLGDKPTGKRNVAVVTYGETADTKSGLSHDLEALRGKPSEDGRYESQKVWVDGYWLGFIWIPGHWEEQLVWVPNGEMTYSGGAINSIRELGNTGTNIQAGLKEARDILSDSSAEYKYVLLLSDGEPTYYYNGTYSGYQSANPDDFIPVGPKYNRYQQDYVYTDFNYWEIKGDGSETSKHHAYNTVSEALLLKQAGVEIYGVGIDLQNSNSAKYTMYNTVSRDQSGNYQSHYINCTASSGDELAEELNKAFTIIESNITVKTNAWIVSDQMSQYASFAGFADRQDAGAVEQSGRITWNLKNLAAFDEKDGDWFVYTCQYYVMLDPAYRDGSAYETNASATLTYSFEDVVYENDCTDENGVQHYKGEQILFTHDFLKPTVKGYAGELGFTKIASDTEKALLGAQFQLKEASDVINWSREVTSVADGKVEFTNIPSGYTYTLTETRAPEGYNKVDPITVTVAYGKVTTNPEIEDGKLVDPAQQSYINVPITKTWQKPADQATPDSITVTLLQDGTEYKTVTLTAEDCTVSGNTWTYVFENLPEFAPDGEPYVYTVKEAAMDGWDVSYDGYSITNTASGKTFVVVDKEWILPEGMAADSASVSVTLTQNGKVMTGSEYTKTIYGNNSVIFNNLEKYDENGQLYVYDVIENGSSYTAAGKVVDTSEGYTHISLTNTVAYELITVSGTKTWNDGGDVDSRPASIEVALLADGEPTGQKVTVTAEDNWTYSFTGLDRYEFTRDGNNNITGVSEIEYTVKETPVDGYKSVVNGADITNTRTGTIDLTVSKRWVAESVPDQKVTVELYANGVATGKTVTFEDFDTFEDLPQYDAQGNEIQYSVVETPVDGFTASYGGLVEVADGVYEITVTNTQNGFDPEEEVLVTVTKVWQQPGSVEEQTADFYLCIDGERSDYSISITGNGTASFNPMPRYDEVLNEETGETEYVEISYSVEEDAPDNYTVSVEDPVGPDSNGNIYYHFINTIQGTTSLSLEKTWVQPADVDTPVATFTIQRSVDGQNWEEVSPITLMDGKTSETRDNLEKYDGNGQLYIYRVVENAIPGYSSVITGGMQEDGSFAFEAVNTINQATANITVSKTCTGCR